MAHTLSWKSRKISFLCGEKRGKLTRYIRRRLVTSPDQILRPFSSAVGVFPTLFCENPDSLFQDIFPAPASVYIFYVGSCFHTNPYLLPFGTFLVSFPLVAKNTPLRTCHTCPIPCHPDLWLNPLFQNKYRGWGFTLLTSWYRISNLINNPWFIIPTELR